MGLQLKKKLADFEEKVGQFSNCYLYMTNEEKDTNDQNVIAAWKLIMRNNLEKLKERLTVLKEEIVWSLLDEQQTKVRELTVKLRNCISRYKGFETDSIYLDQVNEIIFLAEEGMNGFRLSYSKGEYYEELFRSEYEKYKEKNFERLEYVYTVDYQDKILVCPSEIQCKKEMLAERTQQLFDCKFGKIYHDQGRKIKLLASYIIDQHEPDYSNIHEFMDKYIAYQIAKERCTGAEQEPAFRNIVFKENVDVDQVMRKLQELVKDKTISAQKHWFIVFKVFTEKGWLANTKQSSFTEQINITFRNVLKCSVEDFRKVEAYFKNKNFEDWTLDDRLAPSCCDMYRSIADKLDHEFQELKYAKPGRLINTGKSRKSV